MTMRLRLELPVSALPIEKGGMGLTNISLVSLTAFPCSFAASLRDLAKSFPNWITLGREGRLQRISENESPSLAAQVLNSIDQYRTLAPVTSNAELYIFNQEDSQE